MGDDTYISFGNLTYDGTEKPCDRYQQFSEQSQQTETASIKKRYQLFIVRIPLTNTFSLFFGRAVATDISFFES